MKDAASHLEQIAARALTLYSRPTVAIELVRLAEEERVDADTLYRCVAQDPALAGKILRVVNSSLYGLNRPVSDLRQAIGLLGIKPLKLLGLGFSLPDALFAEVAANVLRWYWTGTLTRAVSARLIAEQLWHQPGDEAFTAGLLQDIGILVLLHELGEPYAKFLNGAFEEKCHLAALEQDTLGFDHTQLSAAVLKRWHLPTRLVEAIAMPKRPAKLCHMTSPEGDLPQILHLAELLMQLVGQRRLNVLPDLLEAGKDYRGMTKSSLTALVDSLQLQVDQLAEVLLLELAEKRDFMGILIEAQQRMAYLSEQIVLVSPETNDAPVDQLLQETNEISHAMQSFLNAQTAEAAQSTKPSLTNSEGLQTGSLLTLKLVSAAKRCRDRRHELSLILIEPNVYDIHTDPFAETANRQARVSIQIACAALNPNRVAMIAMSEQRTAVLVSNCDRSAAVALAYRAIAQIERLVGVESGGNVDLATTLSIGVATSTIVPRNFDPTHMVESAMRCLAAARTCGISAVKSIEV